MTHARPFCRSRGVATFFAVAALGLVAAAVLALTTVLRIDHRRTQASVVDAQLRQLLLAGADAAASGLDQAATGQAWTAVELPEGLTALDGSVRWRREPVGSTPTDDEVHLIVAVAARYAGESAGQTLVFVPDPGGAENRLHSAVYRP